MKRVFILVGILVAVVGSLPSQHLRTRTYGRVGLNTPGSPKTGGYQREPQIPGSLPVPVEKTIPDRFDIIETDGLAHIVRSPKGRYRSFDDMPAAIKAQWSNLQPSRASSDRGKLAKTMAAFVVSDAGDAGDPDLNDGVYSPHTLRSAIQNANKLAVATSITFAPGISSIQPLSPLPSVSVALIIDGTVSAGKVIVDGSATSATIGLSLGKTSTVTNMVFKSWKSVGLALTSGAISSTVQECEFTLNSIGLNVNSAQTLVGNETPGNRNLAYGNTQDGIDIVFANDNVIVNNFCGTKDGTTASPNTYDGVYVLGDRNRVKKNVLSGNQGSGLEIGELSNHTIVETNFIGVDVTGNAGLSNTNNGINTFASGDSIVYNIISGNGYGITVLGQSSNAYIGQNTIGVNYSHDGLIGNTYGGLQILGKSVVIDNNFICGNANAGILISGWGGVRVKRNYIGVDPTGMLDWGNSGPGINILTDNNVIGGPDISDRNLISGNDGNGIEMYGGVTLSFPGPNKPNYVQGNIIQFNYIGTNVAGSGILSNANGISMQGYVDSNFVYNNLISGNQQYGIWLRPTPGSPTRNFFSGNYIGTDQSGLHAIPNASAGVYVQAGSYNVIGGPTSAYENLISGNLGPGIRMEVTWGNTIANNKIGTDVIGFGPISNLGDGVLLSNSAWDNLIQHNLISGNLGNGVNLSAASGLLPSGNVIIGNSIGTDDFRSSSIPNIGCGVLIDNALNTLIGGASADSTNYISGNAGEGVYIYGDASTGNMIRGNFIGVDEFGGGAVPNFRGVLISHSGGNIVGGSESGSGNLISGNSQEGVYLYAADSNLVYNNIIGLDLQQTKTVPNGYAGVVLDSANYNAIGGDQAFTPNAIAGNTLSGIVVMNNATGNGIFNNTIGTDYTGTKEFGNDEYGIEIISGANRTIIGKPGAGNKIKFNGYTGILVADSNKNAISANSMYSNGSLGIDLYAGDFGVTSNDQFDGDGGANDLQNFPEPLLAVGSLPFRIYGELHSKPNQTYRVEFFTADSADPSGYGEGNNYVGSMYVATNGLGVASIDTSFSVAEAPGSFITSTATDSAGNTSEFSRCTKVVSSGLFADVAVTVRANVDTLKRTDSLVYVFTVHNNGPDTATHVALRDTLSSRMTLLSDSASRGTATLTNRVLTLTVDTLAKGDSVLVLVVVRTDSTGIILNKAYVSAQEPDFNLGNNVSADTATVKGTTGVENESEKLPRSYQLAQNYPNPFNPSTNIRFEIPASGFVSLVVFDILGRRVATLVDEKKPAGRYDVKWDAKELSSGVYFYRLSAEKFVSTRKLILLK